jgi:hypothetical protein
MHESYNNIAKDPTPKAMLHSSLPSMPRKKTLYFHPAEAHNQRNN